MTDPSPLLKVPSQSAVLLYESDESSAANVVIGWRDAGLTVRTVRGRKMRTEDGLFDEMSAALQFPYYFGENWPAFGECIADMDWLPLDVGIVIVIYEAGQVLAEANLSVLMRAIDRASKTYGEPIAAGEWWDRPAVPFHVVLQALPADAATVRDRWQRAGARVEDLNPA